MTTQVIDRRIESKAKNTGLWILQGASAAMFFQAAFMKLSGNPQMVGLFEAIGLGQGFRLVTGAIELAAAILLFVPRLAGVGALLLVPTMLGAVLTHAFIVGGSAIPAISLLIVSSLIAYGRWDRTRGLLSR